MYIEQPETDSIEAHVQAFINKSTPAAPAEVIEQTESPEDNPEDDEIEEGAEADEPEDETEGEDEATDEDTEEPSYTIKVDGKEKTVPLSELLSLAQKGDDYTQKTTKVAEERRALEAEKAKVADLSTVRENFLTESKTLQGIIEGFIVPQERLDVLLRENKTEDYLKAKAHNERLQQQITTLRSRDEQVRAEITKEQQEAIAQRENVEREALLAKVPEFSDPAYTEGFVKYVTSLGYTPDDIKATLDHRLFVVLDKARRFDELQSKAKTKPVAKVPKVTKGEAPRKTAAEAQSARLRELATKAKRTGSVDDHVALYLAKQKGA